MGIELTGDELILALLSLIRTNDPTMLRQAPEGFALDLNRLERKPELNADEQLILRLHATLERAETIHMLDLSVAEARRLIETLEALDALHPWPPDVKEISQHLRARLAGVE